MTAGSDAGIVLCGGESRRMGRDKASLPFGPETLLERVVRRLAEAARPIVVVAAERQDLPPLPDGVRVIRDPTPGRGPWQGISAGLHALRGQADAVFVTSCDSPFLQPNWVRHLSESLGDHICAVPLIGGRLQPLAAIYRMQALPHIDALLASESARPHALFDRVATRFVSERDLQPIDPAFETLRNINSPEHYRQALADAGFASV
jgi:molybdopterin-guanine dinucleotide biosynthesis protein A